MRKNVNKLATLVMTGMLAASMSFSAFATTTPTENGAATNGARKITKKVTTDGKTCAPNTKFEFNVSAVVVNSDQDKKDFATTNGTKNYTIYSGIADAIDDTGAVAEFSSGNSVSGAYTAEFEVKFIESKFEQPGIYKYNLKETNGGYKGITYDQKATANGYDMYVFVVKEGNKNVVKNIVLEGENGKIDEIVNDYGLSANTVHDLYVTKAVTGNAHSANDSFTFNISVNADQANEKFAIYEVVNGDDKETPSYFVDGKNDNNEGTGTNETIQLTGVKDGTTYHICGLTADDQVVVQELEAGQGGYVTKYKLTDATEVGTHNENTLDTNNNTVTAKAVTDGAELKITNNRDAITPTGVAMDVAPYALMVALAGGAAVTFLRKKESFED